MHATLHNSYRKSECAVSHSEITYVGNTSLYKYTTRYSKLNGVFDVYNDVTRQAQQCLFIAHVQSSVGGIYVNVSKTHL